ncbi:hypothetical protein [Vibrio methylphosphonaticus]|uniref:hypothetical protein n=1 Tax=Vibrio methylphosphonaticus TaxID=2946866 RepID=UPI00202A039A|nr:hypothetical protein [Vibrio methylphosphonaticus]MCL9777202.1 hypothetical protein [Vibrio methylphosphonaticus]
MATSFQITLAPKYYLDNFQTLLGYVKHLYADLLNQEEHRWIERFAELTEDAQCLLIRLMTRKGEWFRSDKLHYSELQSIDHCIDELVDKQFISTNSTDFATLASTLLTKAEILDFYPDLPKTTRKPELLLRLADLAESPSVKLPFTAIQLLDNDKLSLFCLLFLVTNIKSLLSLSLMISEFIVLNAMKYHQIHAYLMNEKILIRQWHFTLYQSNTK